MKLFLPQILNSVQWEKSAVSVSVFPPSWCGQTRQQSKRCSFKLPDELGIHSLFAGLTSFGLIQFLFRLFWNTADFNLYPSQTFPCSYMSWPYANGSGATKVTLFSRVAHICCSMCLSISLWQKTGANPPSLSSPPCFLLMMFVLAVRALKIIQQCKKKHT